MNRFFASITLCVAASCANSSLTGPCADGIDNDKDGWIDMADPGCAFNDGLSESPNPPLPQCSDGIDNDGDGDRDYPADRSCESPEDDDEFGKKLPACSDGEDNDGDGFRDYPNDPGCALPDEDSEKDDCPGGDTCPQCANGIDDDGDGDVDYPADKGCLTASDRQEASPSANECGQQVLLSTIAADGGSMYGSAATQTPSESEGSCGGRGQESAFKLDITTRAAVLISTDHAETTLDTVIYVRSVCDDPTTELGCNDDANNRQSELLVTLNPGTYYVVVDAVDGNAAGQFHLTTKSFTPPGDACDVANPHCVPGYLCRKLLPSAATETCELPECEDGIDNDGDGKTDYPFEPGCESASDNSESDECPDGASCPQCGNQRDDDVNGSTDYPNDVSCSSAADPLEIPCTGETDPVFFQNQPSGPGTTTGKTNDSSPSCGFSNAPETIHAFVVPGELATLQVDTNGSSFDTILSIKAGDCGAADIACDDDGGDSTRSLVTMTDVLPGAYLAVINGYSSSTGNYILNIRGEIKSGETCDPAAEASGMFPCELGFSCQNGTCQSATCNDGIDNDGDGFTDYPYDPGCDTASDNDETDDCPNGANCPACANGQDDDGDNAIDGNDPGCIAASDNDEADECIPGVGFSVLTDAGVTGNTGSGSNFSPSCHSSTSSAEDVYRYALTRDLVTLTFSTEGSTGDTVLSTRYQECGDPLAELACNQVANAGEQVTINNPTQGGYFVFVDGDYTSNIDYELNVSGTLPEGASCNASSDQFTCHDGLVCEGSQCVRSDCNDGADNDGDGLVDFPDEPGCADLSDNDESDNCPNGAGCPACGNGTDDDYDNLTDFAGGDPGCQSASDDFEIDPCIAGVEVEVLTNAGAVGTTPPYAAGSNFSPTCHSSTFYPEVVYHYRVDQAYDSITFSTVGSQGDTVTSVRYGTCGDPNAEVSCLNVQNGGEAVTVAHPPSGDYYIFIDGDFVSEIDYVLNVSATLPLGATCNAADTQFTCATGAVCQSGTCQPTDCNDGVDNDGDGLVDFPYEPGCLGIEDDDETDDCPGGANCPACANQADDDGDTLSDFGSDPGCESASDPIEIDDCAPGSPVLSLPVTGASGTTPPNGAGSAFSGSCNGSTTATEDVYGFELTENLATLTFSTVGSAGDTVTYVRYDTCDAAANEVACTNTQAGGEEVTLTSPPLGNYFVFVDGDYVTGIDYVLNYYGTIAAGGACDAANTQFTCETGTSCINSVCIATACSDGIDNDGDGVFDFPDDPGCYSIADTDESDTCPAGTGCPACANLTDDDGDSFTDAADPGCAFPSDVSETTCPDMDPVIDVRASPVISSTASGSHDHTPSCRSSSTANDQVFTVVSPGALTSLVVSTDGSDFDTVMYVKYNDCAASELDCDDDGGNSTQSKITLANQPAGEYFIFVDGYGSASGNVQLNVTGVLDPGEPCNPWQPYLECTAGETCSATTGGGFSCQ